MILAAEPAENTADAKRDMDRRPDMACEQLGSALGAAQGEPVRQ